MKLRTPLIISGLAFALLGVGPGCAKKPRTAQLRNRSAATLLAQGEQQLKQGNWKEGRTTLHLIEENMPSSPEFPKAKLLLGDSFFFANPPSYPEAIVEYQTFLTYFPRHEMRDYALYHIALCHYAAIEDAERDQSETRQALTAFQNFLQEAPGSPYAPEAKAKVNQCWRRLAESELMVGIFYVKSRDYIGAENRIKGMLENYPEHADLERAYYYLGEALRHKTVPPAQLDQLQRDFLSRSGKDELAQLGSLEKKQLDREIEAYKQAESQNYRQEARTYFQKLVESYPRSAWTKQARTSLKDMGKG